MYVWGCWGSSRWAMGSGLLFSERRCVSGSILDALRPKTALQGWTDIPTFLRREGRAQPDSQGSPLRDRDAI